MAVTPRGSIITPIDNVQITFHPMASETGDSSAAVYSSVFDVSTFSRMIAMLVIVQIAGTSASLTVSFEDSMDGQNWVPNTTFAAQASAGVLKLNVTNIARFIRAKYAYAGTDTRVTFSVLGIAREF